MTEKEKRYNFITVCPSCKKKQIVRLTAEQSANYILWKTGKDNRNIQQVFPELTANQREKLKTGYCNKCWDELCNDDAIWERNLPNE